MSDEIWSRDEPDTPCVKVCVMHPTEGLCVGCYRTLAEIGAWSRLSRPERLALMAELPARAERLKKRRGGRAARPPE
ncbi:DUF1289 domain-containing protein [Rhodobacter lacus]|uniref:DUF1289 domain-containing protein n=1 Tax=Rhodobacter lacus TaxID=1641972 RepID=A0ABW5AC79_9RHOB